MSGKFKKRGRIIQIQDQLITQAGSFDGQVCSAIHGRAKPGREAEWRAVLDQMPSDVETSLILNTADLTGLDLLKLIAAEFRLQGPFESRADWRRTVTLTDRHHTRMPDAREPAAPIEARSPSP